MTVFETHRLDDCWGDSIGEPLPLYEQDDPQVQTGSYVIEPGERVPPTGTTSHGGPELSVILSGDIRIVAGGEERVVGPETLVAIPAAVDHFSENIGDEPVRLVYTVVGEL